MSEFKFPIQNPYEGLPDPYAILDQRGRALDDSPQLTDPNDPDTWIVPDDDYSDSGISTFESGVRGLGQGATFGFEDEIRGGVLGGYDALTSDESFGDAYTRNRDEIRALNEQAREANPMSYMGGEVLGGIASGVAAAPLTGGASFAGGAARMAGTLGAQGAVAGLGYSEAEDLGGMAQSAALGGALGAGLGTGAAYGMRGVGRKLGGMMGGSGEVVQRAVNKLPGGIASIKIGDMLRGRAVANANKVLGTSKLNLPEDEALVLGRLALDEGILSNPSPDAIRRNILKQNDIFNNALLDPKSPYYDTLDTVTLSIGKDQRNYAAVARQQAKELPEDSIERNGLLRFADELGTISSGKNEVSGIEIATAMNKLAKEANFSSTTPTRAEQASRIAYGRMADSLSEAVSETRFSINSMLRRTMNDAQQYAKNNNNDFTRQRLEIIAENTMDVQDMLNIHKQQLPFITSNAALARLVGQVGTEIDTVTPRIDEGTITSIGSQALGGVGAYTGGSAITDDPTLQAGIGLAGAALGSKASPILARELNKIATRASTTGLDQLGKKLGGNASTPNVVKTPQAPQTSNLKQKFGKFTGVLEKAKERGQHNFAITYQALFNQSEEFRNLVRNSEENE